MPKCQLFAAALWRIEMKMAAHSVCDCRVFMNLVSLGKKGKSKNAIEMLLFPRV